MQSKQSMKQAEIPDLISVQNSERLQTYISIAHNLLNYGEIYYQQGENSNALISFQKFNSLVSQLERHNAANTPQYKTSIKGLQSKLPMQAEQNTMKDLELCGVLCGILEGGQYKINTLIIPQQQFTSTQCEMTDELQIFQICNKQKLMVLGWIHTHPAFQLFLSQTDMHTQYTYQALLPEAVAIVWSGIENNYAVFQITSTGMKELSKCQRTFCKHPESLYKVPSHIQISGSRNIQIIDKR